MGKEDQSELHQQSPSELEEVRKRRQQVRLDITKNITPIFLSGYTVDDKVTLPNGPEDFHGIHANSLRNSFDSLTDYTNSHDVTQSGFKSVNDFFSTAYIWIAKEWVQKSHEVKEENRKKSMLQPGTIEYMAAHRSFSDDTQFIEISVINFLNKTAKLYHEEKTGKK